MQGTKLEDAGEFVVDNTSLATQTHTHTIIYIHLQIQLQLEIQLQLLPQRHGNVAGNAARSLFALNAAQSTRIACPLSLSLSITHTRFHSHFA